MRESAFYVIPFAVLTLVYTTNPHGPPYTYVLHSYVTVNRDFESHDFLDRFALPTKNTLPKLSPRNTKNCDSMETFPSKVHDISHT